MWIFWFEFNTVETLKNLSLLDSVKTSLTFATFL